MQQPGKCVPARQEAQPLTQPQPRLIKAPAQPGNALRRAAAAFGVAIPLLAASAGCEQDGCKVHNISTVSLNREVDGTIPPLEELMRPPEGGLVISEPAIDLLNESQSLSSGGMPAGSSLTMVEKACFSPERIAFACWEDTYTQDRGIYVPGPVILLGRPSASALGEVDKIDIMTIFHELGHLQDGGEGNEVLPELNRFEQIFMVHVLLSRNDPGSQKTWAVLVRGLEDEIYYPAVPSGYRDFGTVQRIEAFIIMELMRYDGDFGAVREHVRQLVSTGRINGAVDDAVRSYGEQYGDPDPSREANNLANLVASLRMSIARWLSVKFGVPEAVAYSNTMSAKVALSEEGLTQGLDGMACAMMDRRNMGFQPATTPDPLQAAEMCPEMLEVVSVRTVSEGARLCCFSPAPGPLGLGFRKFVARVGGYECTGSLGLQDYPSAWVKHLNVEGTEEISLDAQCE